MGQSLTKQTKITFHKNHGEDIELGEDSAAAVRFENRASCWSNGLLFSAEPIKTNQKIYLKLVVVSRACHDVVSVGFTSLDPTEIQFMESEISSTSWTCSLSKYFCSEDAVICFYINNSGIIYYGKSNGTQFKVWNKKVDLSKPVWAVVHIWSEPTTVKLVNQNEVRQSVFKEDAVVEQECEQIRRKVMKDAVAVTETARSEEEICCICYITTVEVVFIPCGHLCCCYQCGQTIEKKDNLCPICRKTIGSVVRVYKSW